MRIKILDSAFIAIIASGLIQTACADTSAMKNDGISVRVTPTAGRVVMLDTINGFGGGNIAVSTGDDGILLVDTMLANTAPKVQETLGRLSDKPVRIIVNTHHHGDHIGGNAALGANATIIAHETLRDRRLKSTKETSAQAGLPVVTFSQRLRLHFNNESIELIHLDNGHTDNDVAVFFVQSKVLHLGDMFFNGMFPAVYPEGGGNIMQLIRNLEGIMAEVPADTVVIPGHGPLANLTDLGAYIAMLKETTMLVEEALKRGMTLEQMKARKLLVKYDALGKGGAQTTDQFTGMLVKLLSTAPAKGIN